MKKIFFIGIGGKGLNGIAQICLEKGFQVYGVDRQKSLETEYLKSVGAKIFYKHNSLNLPADIDLVVKTSIVENSPEIAKAKKLGIPILNRSEFLKELIKKDFKISIAGSHGKSTTTAVLGLSLLKAGLKPNIYGGAFIKEIQSYNYLGKGEISVVEACEYGRAFYDLVGDATIITRAEKSHLEYYKDEEDMLSAYRHFINLHKRDATIFINGDDLNLLKVISSATARIITFGCGELNDYQVVNIKLEKDHTVFDLICKKQFNKILLKNFKIKIPGIYNVLNFAATIALFNEFDFDVNSVKNVADEFNGVGRRFEIKETEEGLILVDDFAHHPTQVKNLMDSLRQFYPDQKICAVFQPRQFNLIKNFLIEYGESFVQSDEVILTDILPALGDKPEDINSLKAIDVKNAIQIYSQKKVTLKNNFREIADYVKSHFGRNSVLAMVGAGDINQISNFFKIK